MTRHVSIGAAVRLGSALLMWGLYVRRLAVLMIIIAVACWYTADVLTLTLPYCAHAAEAAANGEPIAKEIEEDANAEDDEGAEENALATTAAPAAAPNSGKKARKVKKPTQQVGHGLLV